MIMEDHPVYSRNTLMDFIKLKPKDIEICDVTLRDGEQAAGIAFTEQEKIDIARKLDDVGVEIIEAGFPVVSKEELTTIRNIAKLGLNARICCLARAKTSDVDSALDANVDIVSIFIATSDIHLRYKHHMTIDEATDCAIDVVDYAKDHGLAVRFAAEDATRTDMDVLKQVYRIAELHNADYLSIADTVGILDPSTTYFMIKEIKKATNTPLCIHCHNDLGMATANTIVAAETGATQLHATVNGIGERVGNTPLEELLVGLLIQYGIDKYDLSHLLSLSKMVEKYSGVKVAKTKPIVGENAFCHESGIHIAAMLENTSTYEVFSPELVGGGRNYIIGKHTGKKALKFVTERLGYDLDQDHLCALLDKIKVCSEAKHGVSCDRLAKMIDEME